MLDTGLTDQEAFDLEAELVNVLREYLCNLHEGGKGFSSGPLHHMFNKTPSPEHRAKISVSLTGELHYRYQKENPTHMAERKRKYWADPANKQAQRNRRLKRETLKKEGKYESN